MNKPHPDARVQKIVHFYENLSPESLNLIAGVYTENAQFKDPFNEVSGQNAIKRIFAHMFTALKKPQFRVSEALLEGSTLCLTWDFEFERSGLPRPMRIHGASLLHLAADGRITQHRDYWDSSEELLQKVPVLGGLMRFLAHQLKTPTH